MTFFACQMKAGGFIRKQLGPDNLPLTIMEFYGRSKTVLKIFDLIQNDLRLSKISLSILVCEKIDISKGYPAEFVKEKTNEFLLNKDYKGAISSCSSGFQTSTFSADLNFVYEGDLDHSFFSQFKKLITSIDKTKLMLDGVNYYSKKFLG